MTQQRNYRWLLVVQLYLVTALWGAVQVGGESFVMRWMVTGFQASAVSMWVVLDASLLFFHFRLGSSSDVNLSNSTGKLGDPFVQLFLVVVAGRVFEFTTNLIDSSFDVG